MSTLAEEFVAWTLAGERTLEEAFFAEILIEEGLRQWKAREQIEDPDRYNHEMLREYRRRRRLNPAHRRIWSEIEVQRAAELVTDFSVLRHWTYGEDRDVCDLSALLFCPKLKDLQLAPTELMSLDGLRHVPLLEHLWLQDDILEDLSPLRLCPRLKTVHLWLGYPWCDMRSLADLPELEQVTFHGNLPSLEGVGPLPKVTKVLFEGWGNSRAPIRDGHALPNMAALREAQISPIACLAGCEKYAALEEVTFEGPYKSIAPLAALSEVRKLVLGGNRYHDLAPVASMAKLAVLRLAREFPLDYTALLASESLRELERCADRPLTPEQAGINAALGGWDQDCLLPEPRSLPRPVYRFIQHVEDPPPPPEFAARRGSRVTPTLEPVVEAQAKWLAQRLDRAMIRAYGRDWGETYAGSFDAHRGSVDVTIHDIEIADALGEVIELLRRELAWLRDRWVIDLIIDPHAQWQRDPEEWKDDVDEDLEDRIQEAKNYAQRRRDYLAYLDRLRVYQERQEQGATPRPEEFAPPVEHEEEEPDSDVLEPPESGTDVAWESEHHPRWHEYYMGVHVTEEGVWVPVGYRKTARRLLLQPIEKFPGWEEAYDNDEDE